MMYDHIQIIDGDHSIENTRVDPIRQEKYYPSNEETHSASLELRLPLRNPESKHKPKNLPFSTNIQLHKDLN